MDYMKMGQKIRSLREERDMTQSVLSEIVGISDRELSNIEVGKVKPLFNTILLISQALNVSLDYLTSDSSEADIDIYIHEVDHRLKKMKVNHIQHIIRYIDLFMDNNNTIC